MALAAIDMVVWEWRKLVGSVGYAAHCLEYVDWWNPVLANPLEINNGMAVIEGRVSSGIEWNEGRVKEFSV